jgi:hypothetical protein
VPEPQRLGDRCIAPCQCPVGIAATEINGRQDRLRGYVRIDSGLIDKRGVRGPVIERKRLFEMRLRRYQPADKHQGSASGVVGQNKPGRIVALAAETQQILVHAQCQIELAADRVIDRLAARDMKELRRRAQPFPQFSCADIGVAGFRRSEAFDRLQYRTQGTVEFELPALTRSIVRQ